MTKLYLFLFILFTYSFQSKGQLVANAGRDIIVCAGADTTAIGGRPVASGGSGPYKYTWTTNAKIGATTYNETIFLDDPSLANPKIVNSFINDLMFYVKVEDINGVVAIDSVSVRFSDFSFLTANFFAEINAGDTAGLQHVIGGGIAPLRFSWSPNYNISDTSVSNPKAWPETTTQYTVYATDSAGCVSDPYTFRVFVTPLGVFSQYDNIEFSSVYPNPVNTDSRISFNNPTGNSMTINIYNSEGQVLLTDTFSEDNFQLIDRINKEGMYFYVLMQDSKVFSSGKFIKK